MIVRRPGFPARRLKVFIGLLAAVLVVGLIIGRFQVEVWGRQVLALFDPTIPQLHNLSTAVYNVQYCGGKDPQQRLDLYTPKTTAIGKRPLVVYIHGGGWQSGNKQNSVVLNYGPAAINAGYTFVSMNYDLAPTAHYPVQPQEVTCALGFLNQQARQFNIDTSRTVLMGDSAGGQLAALTGLRPVSSGRIRGVIDLYGDTDLVAQLRRRPHPNGNVRVYLGTTDEQLAKQASPITYIHPGAPPFLIIHGRNDTVVPITQSYNFAHALERAKVPVRMIAIDHAGHAFGLQSRAQPNIPQLNTQIQDFLTQLK